MIRFCARRRPSFASTFSRPQTPARDRPSRARATAGMVSPAASIDSSTSSSAAVQNGRDACDAASGDVWIANSNAAGQVVIAGDPDAIVEATALAKERGARKVLALPVGGAFHTPFMVPAAERLRAALAAIEFADASMPIVANVDALPHQHADQWADLLDHSGVARNPLGRADVEISFEVRNTRSGGGRMYASGSAKYGGYFQGVDTFLGLQFSSQKIADDLASVGFGKRIGVTRSLSNWLKWMRHKELSKA